MSSTPKTPVTGDKKGETSGGAPRTVAAERVTGGTVELPMLTKSNYHEWSLVMKVSLEALGLWAAVETGDAENREDRMALAVILRAVPLEMKAGLAVKKTAKEAWDAVKAKRVGDDRVKSANVQRILKEFETVAFHAGESVDEFAVRIDGLVTSLRDLGETMEDSRVVKKILRVVPKKLKQVAVAIEMFLDLNTLPVDELVGRLRVAEQADEEDEKTGGAARLLLTEEQWEARRRGGKERARGGEGRRGGEARRGSGGKSGGEYDDDDGGSSTCSGRSERRNRGRCFNCGVRGHLARDCKEPKKGKALLADADEEPCLL
ncbi:hypothetical protein ACP70R_026314 [Stipagrostis hirtigluma subsp. patula]